MIPLQFGLIAILTLIATPYVSNPYNPINVSLGNLINYLILRFKNLYDRSRPIPETNQNPELIFRPSAIIPEHESEDSIITEANNRAINATFADIAAEAAAEVTIAAEDEPITTVPSIQDPELISMPLATISEHESESETEYSVLPPKNLLPYFEATAEDAPITTVPELEDSEVITGFLELIPVIGDSESGFENEKDRLDFMIYSRKVRVLATQLSDKIADYESYTSSYLRSYIHVHEAFYDSKQQFQNIATKLKLEQLQYFKNFCNFHQCKLDLLFNCESITQYPDSMFFNDSIIDHTRGSQLARIYQKLRYVYRNYVDTQRKVYHLNKQIVLLHKDLKDAFYARDRFFSKLFPLLQQDFALMHIALIEYMGLVEFVKDTIDIGPRVVQDQRSDPLGPVNSFLGSHGYMIRRIQWHLERLKVL